MDGLLLIDKPKGWTSFDVVAKVRGILRQATGLKKIKVGHSGTLDPAATGLLLLAIGTYTKRIPELTKLDKTYEAELTLGSQSTTADSEGEITQVSMTKPSHDQVVAALESFVGAIEQIPPAYSAIKINGKKAYELARAGKKVELKPRLITIYSITNTTYNYPIVQFSVSVSSGTYIRSLAVDIGNKLQTGAYLSNLRRTQVGQFNINQAISVENIQSQIIKDNLQALQ